jgi:hypothetical protein
MSDAAVNISVELEKIDCPSCNALYALSSYYINRRRKDGRGWQCPYCANGTSFHGDDEISKLKKQLAEEQERKNHALADANILRSQVAAAMTAAEKLKKRAANGVCPCCTRTFSNVAQHMKQKHPEFAEKHKTAPKQKGVPKAKGAYAKQRLAEIKSGSP